MPRIRRAFAPWRRLLETSLRSRNRLRSEGSALYTQLDQQPHTRPSVGFVFSLFGNNGTTRNQTADGRVDFRDGRGYGGTPETFPRLGACNLLEKPNPLGTPF